MVEDAIDDHFNLSGMGAIEEGREGLVSPEDGVNLIVVVGMVAVITGGLKDGG